MAGFWKWFFTGKRDDKSSKSRKQMSLGIGYELQRLFGLIETIDEKQAKLKSLDAEKKLLNKVIEDLNKIEDEIGYDENKFNKSIKRLEIILNNIKAYEENLEKVDKSMDSLSNEIKERAKQTEEDIIKLKREAEVFKELEDKIEEERRKVREELEDVKEKIEKEGRRKAMGYSAVLVGPVDLKKLKKPIVKEVVKQEKPSIEINTNIVVPEAKEKKILEKPRKPKSKAKVVEGKERTAKNKVLKELVPKKVKTEEPKFSKQAEKISDDVVEEALSEGVDEFKPYKKQESKVETEIDQVLEIVRSKGKVSFSKLAKKFEEKMSTIEQWAEALEEQGFIQIVYPLIGSPYMKLKK
ncbi:MAG: hypothetical protein JW791_01065 [Nanoarchaeota archaeon]|nr:hypothetical protein [Nanoarchaeota archaeon]